MFAACVLLAAGCADDDVCAGVQGPCIGLELVAASALDVDQLALTSEAGFAFSADGQARSPDVPRALPAQPPLRLAVIPPAAFAGTFKFQVRALRRTVSVGSAEIAGTLAAQQHLGIVASLIGDLPPGTDLSQPPGVDLATPPGSDLAAPPGSDLAAPPGSDLAVLPDLAPLRDLAVTGTPCDPFKSTSCQSPLKCGFPDGDLTGTSVCESAGPLTPGVACDPANDPCVKGAVCIADDASGLGLVCRQLCTTDHGNGDCTGAAGPGGSENFPFCFADSSMSGLGGCSLPCNPVLKAGSEGCPGGTTCYYRTLPVNEIENTDCLRTPRGAGTDGSACTKDADCADGFSCHQVGAALNKVCRLVCRHGVTSDCQTPLVCKSDGFLAAPIFGLCCPQNGC